MLRIFQPVHEPRFLFGLNNHRYYHSDEDNSRVRIVTVLQGQKDLNPRHAVLESLSRFAAIDYCLLFYHLFTRMIFDF